MPLCSKCHQNVATIHINFLVDGKGNEKQHFCKDCDPTRGLYNLDPKHLEALSITGKKCEFCGKDAFSGEMGATGGIFWCFDCGLEFGHILTDLIISERPDLMRQNKEKSSFFSMCFDPEIRAWSEAVNQKAVQILRDRRRQDGRDKGR